MSDENKNPQNLPIETTNTNAVDQKPSSSNSRKIILIILAIVLLIVVSVSLYALFNRSLTPPFFPSKFTPTVTPKTTDISSPTQETGDLIISIKLGQTITIPNTSISLTYKSADIPGDNCNDCVATNTLEIKNGGLIKTLTYSCGGFSGECTTKQEAFGYQLEVLEQISKDSLKLKIKKQ